jgi:hypothetical protein
MLAFCIQNTHFVAPPTCSFVLKPPAHLMRPRRAGPIESGKFQTYR